MCQLHKRDIHVKLSLSICQHHKQCKWWPWSGCLCASRQNMSDSYLIVPEEHTSQSRIQHILYQHYTRLLHNLYKRFDQKSSTSLKHRRHTSQPLCRCCIAQRDTSYMLRDRVGSNSLNNSRSDNRCSQRHRNRCLTDTSQWGVKWVCSMAPG